MQKSKDIKHWELMIKSLTDPEEKERARHKEKIKKMLEEKKSDTGL